MRFARLNTRSNYALSNRPKASKKGEEYKPIVSIPLVNPYSPPKRGIGVACYFTSDANYLSKNSIPQGLCFYGCDHHLPTEIGQRTVLEI